MNKIDRRGGESKNRILGNYQKMSARVSFIRKFRLKTSNDVWVGSSIQDFGPPPHPLYKKMYMKYFVLFRDKVMTLLDEGSSMDSRRGGEGGLRGSKKPSLRKNPHDVYTIQAIKRKFSYH